MTTIKVDLLSRSYEIIIGSKLLNQLGAYCKGLSLGQRCAVISDSNVAPLYEKSVVASLKKAGFEAIAIRLPAGETAKSLKSVSACYDQLAQNRMERKSFIVALGGGVMGDLAGFVAATYLRGIPFVQIPTTLLAQVDSSVGGKVGINLKAGKNLVGSFHQPRLVLCDFNTLKTLPDREFRSGLAEIIKYGIIYDADLFETLERNMSKLLKRDSKTLTTIVARCCEIKADVVSQDETESGLRAILNFGHTIGHGLEAISGYGKYLHGEAISIGQVAAAKLSNRLLGFSLEDVDRVQTLFTEAGLPVTVKLSRQKRADLHAAMKLDKKVSAGEIKFVLAEKVGRVKFGQRVPLDMIDEVVQELAG